MTHEEIVTDMDINNINGCSNLSLKMFTLSMVESFHLPSCAAAVLQKQTLKFLTAVPGDYSVIWGTLAHGKIILITVVSKRPKRDKLY